MYFHSKYKLCCCILSDNMYFSCDTICVLSDYNNYDVSGRNILQWRKLRQKTQISPSGYYYNSRLKVEKNFIVNSLYCFNNSSNYDCLNQSFDTF